MIPTAGNGEFHEAADVFRRTTEPCLRLTPKVSSTTIVNTTAQYQELLSSIRTGDADLAEAGMRKHILRIDVGSLIRESDLHRRP